MSQSEALTPVIYNLTLTSADTEYSQALPTGTKYASIQCRTAYDMRFAFETTTADVGASTAPYATIKAGQSYSLPEKAGFSWNTDESAVATIYLASSEAGVIAEIVVWKDIR